MAKLGQLKPLVPYILGLAFARAGIIVGCYGGYEGTDDGIWSDGAMLVVVAIFCILIVMLGTKKQQVKNDLVLRISKTSMGIEAFTLICLGAAAAFGQLIGTLRFVLCCGVALSSSGAMFYWLREAKGSGPTVAAVMVFGALAVSEVELLVFNLLPDVGFLGNGFSQVAAAALVLVQFPCMEWASRGEPLRRLRGIDAGDAKFLYSRDIVSDPGFLITTAIGIILMSVVLGLLRGFPNGDAISFTLCTRISYGLLALAVCAAAIFVSLKGHRQLLVVGAFLLMESLAALSLVLYMAFPASLHIGAVTTTVCNAAMVAFTFFITIDFMTEGWLDPYYYAMSGWAVWLGSRSLTRTGLIMAGGSFDPGLMCAVCAALLLVSTQVVFVQFLNLARNHLNPQVDASNQGEGSKPRLSKIMGLGESPAAVRPRYDATYAGTRQMGAQFLLSDRELEVLTLYAMGLTQKSIAEELVISQDTVHVHIKHIYAKTDLHSRSEILDYLKGFVE